MVRVEKTNGVDVTVDGQTYTLVVQCTAYDEENSVLSVVPLLITGDVSESKGQVNGKIQAAMSDWKQKVIATQNFKRKVEI